ncbi:histidine kinase [Rhodovulum euryhalinum]|uniref:Oxygen sensor histidine kinase NreB n=1 Tax=Rhodovulum euryhalinum TaxID=35805 RepID=A0A4R2KM05_9RHOB|nr:histidine kinase [Rhodovulum euryhalinum]TCO71736.1 two-component system sensor histidine kinase UhpB [Rhodovulum euryhalinum]
MIDRLHLRWQVVMCVGVTQALALCVAGWLLLENARKAVVVEMAAAEAGARAQVIASVGAAMRDHPPGAVLGVLSERLVEPRHVRLALFDLRTGPLPVRAGAGEEEGAAPPAWFRALVTPPVRETRLPILDSGRDYGFVSLTSAPQDEIAEVWHDVAALFWTLGGAFLATLALVTAVIGRALRPLETLNRGLGALQSGALSTRISGVRGADFVPLVGGFNALSQSLETSESARAALARKIVELGDAERRAIAMELHDEFGPCLFGLKVKAGAIARAADRAGDPVLKRDAETVTSIVDQIQTANTRLLTTLRPMTIGQLPLVEALADMLDGFRSTHSGIAWQIVLPDAMTGTEEIVDLTVYRFVQEGVTNALRHGAPRRVRVAMELIPQGSEGARAIALAVEDDGAGLPACMAEGRGLTAMRDRVYAIGGMLAIGPRPGGGTRLTAQLPLARARVTGGRPAMEATS